MSLNLNRRSFLKLIGFLSLSSFSQHSLAKGLNFQELPVLLYHEIAYRPLTEYTIKPHQFLAQMELLRALGYISIFPWEVDEKILSSQKAVIITFDDGSYTFLEYAYPVLREYGFKAIMNIIGAKVSKGFNMISWDEYKEVLIDGYLEIGCHSYDFHYLGWSKKLSLREFERDLRKFKKLVSEELGKEVRIFSSPFGEPLTEGHLNILSNLGFEYVLLSEGETREKTYYRPYLEKRIIPRFNVNYRMTLKVFKNLILRPYEGDLL